MIEIKSGPWQTMVAHAEQTYPDECCGIMLGHLGGDRKLVTEAMAVSNVWDGAHGDRYQIAPHDLLEAEKQARSNGLDLVGIFHSHPDADAYFSATDLKHSCPWYSFVVLSVRNGLFDHAGCFRPDLEQTRAEQEELMWPKS